MKVFSNAAKSVAILILSAAGAFGAEPTRTQRLDQIILVFKTHFDIGYTDMATNVVQRYRTTMIDRALEVVDENRGLPPDQQFVWTLSGWPMHKIFEDWPGQTPERMQRIEQALKQGRFVVHALPFTTHTELLEPEDVVRGLDFSSRLTRQLGLPLPRDAKMTDVPEHTWMLATLLHHAGVIFFMIGCNGASGPLHVPPLFWWEGPDGSRVLTRYSPTYGTSLEPDPDWPYRTWLAVLHTGDNQGPPKPQDVKKLLDRAAREFPGVKIRIGRMSDFYDAIMLERPSIPVLRGDAPDTWIHGPMSDPAGACLARHTRPLITATESLNTQLRFWGVPVSNATAAVATADEQSLLYGEHTWGGSIGWLGNRLSFGEDFKRDRAAGRFARSEASWDEHTAYIHKAHDLIAPVWKEDLQALAHGVRVTGPRIVVYNPLPWKRSGIVTVAAADFAPAALKATDTSTVAPVEYIRSLIDKHSGRELAGTAEGFGLGQYLYERFDGNQVTQFCKAYLKPGHMHPDFFKPGLPSAEQCPYQAFSPTNFSLRIEPTPWCTRATLEAPATGQLPAVTTRLILYRDQPCLDLEITLHEKPLDPSPEAGWLCLPLKIEEPRFHLGRLASIIDPSLDLLAGANRYMFGLDTGVMVTGRGGHGVGLCSPDLPLVSLDTPGCWKFSTNFVPKKPVVFINLFNNQWDTNFRLWNQGTWTTRVRLWAIERPAAEPALITPSLESRYPLEAEVANGPGERLPANRSGLGLSRRGILVTAFGANPDGSGTILRLWEYAGNSGACRVQLPEGVETKSVQPINLRGEPDGKPVAVRNRAFEFNLPAFAPATFRIED